MSFVTIEFYEIISVVEDLIFMGDEETPEIEIQTSCEDEPDSDAFDVTTSYCQISCPVKNGRIEIKVYYDGGEIAYFGWCDGVGVREASASAEAYRNDDRLLQTLEFKYDRITDRSGSFQSALREILKTDRQNTTAAWLEKIYELS
jgi:hypothetical protein